MATNDGKQTATTSKMGIEVQIAPARTDLRLVEEVHLDWRARRLIAAELVSCW